MYGVTRIVRHIDKRDEKDGRLRTKQIIQHHSPGVPRYKNKPSERINAEAQKQKRNMQSTNDAAIFNINENGLNLAQDERPSKLRIQSMDFQSAVSK